MKKSLSVCTLVLSMTVLADNPPCEMKEAFPSSLTPVSVDFGKGKVAELVKNGKALAEIVLPEKDIPFSQMIYVEDQKQYRDFYRRGVGEIAADELRKYIALSTGANLEIVRRQTSGKSAIFLCYAENGLKPEGFRIESRDGNVTITALRPSVRNTPYDGIYPMLFGVYDFLERFCGVRFYYPGDDGVYIPKKNSLEIPTLNYSDSPFFEKRQLSGVYEARGTFCGEYPDHTIHMLRLRAGGNGLFGGNRSFCHTPLDLTLHKGTAKAVPDSGWKKPPMPCYGNPATGKALLDSIDDFYTGRGSLNEWRSPQGYLQQPPEEKLIPFSPPDHPLQCQCLFCNPLIDKKAPFYAEASSLYGQFISKLAGELKAKYPDKILFILPYYNYTECPKNLRLPDNVFAQVCLMYGHNLWHDSKERKTSMKWLEDWSRVTGRKIHVYSYPMWPEIETELPVQYPHNLKNFINDISRTSSGLRLDSLRNWNSEFFNHYCAFKLMWNPGFNVDAALREMCNNLYGNASEDMFALFTGIARFYEMLPASEHSEIWAIGPYSCGKISRGLFYEKLLRPEQIGEWKSLLANAEKRFPPHSPEHARIDFFGKPLKKFFLDYDLSAKGFKSGKLPVTRVSSVGGNAGKGAAEFWADIPESRFVNAFPSHAAEPKNKTIFKIAHDGKNIAFLFKMSEPEPNKLFLAQPVWAGDCLELFLEFAPGRIYQFCVNEAGTIFDAAHGGHLKNRIDAPNWKTWRDGNGWCFEMRFPVSTLGKEIVIDPLTPWRCNFTRTRKLQGGDSEVSRWVTRFSRSHLDQAAFGELIFK